MIIYNCKRPTTQKALAPYLRGVNDIVCFKNDKDMTRKEYNTIRKLQAKFAKTALGKLLKLKAKGLA